MEWRLRNLRCGEDDRATLLKAMRAGSAPAPGGEPLVARDPERAYWQDGRGLLHQLREPTAGEAATADELLVAGEAEAARAAYTAQLSGPGPADPHALSGWLLAHTALHPGERRLLARPERIAALLGETPPDRWASTAHWLAGG